jgi:hypothetical protein
VASDTPASMILGGPRRSVPREPAGVPARAMAPATTSPRSGGSRSRTMSKRSRMARTPAYPRPCSPRRR